MEDLFKSGWDSEKLRENDAKIGEREFRVWIGNSRKKED